MKALPTPKRGIVRPNVANLYQNVLMPVAPPPAGSPCLMRKLSKKPVAFLVACAAPVLVFIVLVLTFGLFGESQLIDVLFFASSQLALMSIPIGSGLALAYSWQNRARLRADRHYLALLLALGHVLLLGLSLALIYWLIV